MSLSSLLRSCLPVELDDPSLEYLTTLVGEEADFIREVPESMTHAQLLHLLTEKLEETLVTFELVKLESEARRLCDQIIRKLTAEKYIALAAGDEEESGTAANAPSDVYTPPALSAPVRISDITRADESRESELEFSMAQIQRAAAKSRWSVDEERVIFQSLADTPTDAHGEDDEADAAGEGGCEMCQREMPLTRHHLIPRMMHKRKPWASQSSDYLNNKVTLICRPCHSAVHRMADEKTLATDFHTIELIRADERMQRWIAYIAKKRINRTVAQTKSGARLHYSK